MTREWLFIFLFGLTSIIGLFLTSFWTRLAYARMREINGHWYHDRASVLALAIASIAGGIVLTNGARVLGSMHHGLIGFLSDGRLATAIGIGMALIVVGFFKMTWLADLEQHPPKWTWLRAMLGFTVLWSVVAAILAGGM